MDIRDKYPDLRDDDFLRSFDFAGCYTRLHPDRAMCEFDVAVAALVFEGNLSLICRALGRSRSSLSGFVARNEMLVDLFNDVEQTFIDEIEVLHKEAARRGDLQSQRFFLTTKGKDRGYSTRTESTGKDAGPVQMHTVIELVAPKLNDDRQD